MPPGPCAVRIFTGAPMPEGADTVFMQEDVSVLAGSASPAHEIVVLPHGLKRGANARPRGEDLPHGAVAIPAGKRLQPQDIGLAAATGYTGLDVRRRLSVGVFSTGNELREPGTSLQPGAIHDANRYLLMALLRRAGAEPSDLGILPDRHDAVRRALHDAASQCDLIITSGGVSTGEEDHVKAAVAEVGSLVFWRIAIKPGRPVAMGVIGGTPFMGLPGNPVAAYITFAMLARPLLQLLGGEALHPPRRKGVTLGFDYTKKPGRREYVRVRVAPGADGAMQALKHPQDGAGVITSLTQTDGLLELPEETTRLFAGEEVQFLSWAELLG
jgi:molybdopterin molybdotransferase